MASKAKMPAGGKGKPGPTSVGASAKGSSPSRNVPGGPGKSVPQAPIPGPAGAGQPAAMKKALAKKSRPDKGTSFPGLVR